MEDFDKTVFVDLCSKSNYLDVPLGCKACNEHTTSYLIVI